jgi:hypothetical protein
MSMTEVNDQTRADELCCEIASLLPRLGDDVSDALERLEVALDAFVSASEQYDACVRDWASRLPSIAVYTSRVVLDRYRAPTVDGLPLRRIRPEARLAHVVAPAMARLRAPIYVLADLQQLGDAAPDVVTSRRTT